MSEPVIQIRPATGADGPAVRQLVGDVLAEFGFCLDMAETDRTLRDLEQAYQDSGGMFWVAAAGPEIVGTAGLRAKADGVAELEKMYVRPAYRGQGVGRQLFQQVRAWARAHNIRRLELDTATRLRDAIAMYEKYGFQAKPEVGVPRCDRSYFLDLTDAAG